MSDTPIARAYLAAARQQLEAAYEKIEHCLRQLSEEDLRWRSFEGHNSITNIILHLCGNIRQWIICPATGQPDRRNRPLEFSDRTPLSRADLLARLRTTLDEAVAGMSAIKPEMLLTPRRIQGFDTNLLDSIFDSTAHFKGHAQEIVYIARLRLREKYQFKFVPATPEQGAPI